MLYSPKYFLIFLFFSSPFLQAQEKITLGRYNSRGILTTPSSAKEHSLGAIILIPGSGPHGPEETIPLEGNDYHFFNELRDPFHKNNMVTLQLGKPGVDFFNGVSRFYDLNLYLKTKWADLILNVMDAIDYLKNIKSINPSKIYLLGHSEGTQVAVDCASLRADIQGLILLGFAGEDLKTRLDWQLFKRPIEYFLATLVDENHDGKITQEEAAKYEGLFRWDWQQENFVTYQEIETYLRSIPENKNMVEMAKNSSLYGDGIYSRGPIYELAASLPQDIYVFNGALDMQTPVKESLLLGEKCHLFKKENCYINIIEGVGHGFSAPKMPRKHPFLDMSMGPIDASFAKSLTNFAAYLNQVESFN